MAGDHPVGVGRAPGDPAPEPAAKRYVVALSDVHLGTDGPTVWYQRDVHEPYLVHLLDWVVAHADEIRELVLLGDIVDLWTYPADQRPPTFAEIAATHPRIFGPEGKLAEVLDALDGAVSYVAGNHDLGITAEEVAGITSPTGHHVTLVEDEPYLPLGEADPRLALTHGHAFTLFNAPHLRNDWAPLPVGHFITRAVATSWARRLEPGQTVADLPGQGAPNGIDLGSLAAIAIGIGAGSITAAVVDFVAGATGVALDEPMVMPDGTTATLADARRAYADCWTDWANDHGGGFLGHASATRAALADLDGSYLGWFAQQLAFLHGAELVVMGHTHLPVSLLEASPIRYVNTGFDCPSVPDAADATAPQRTTFAVIDTVAMAAEIWEVGLVDDEPDGAEASARGEASALACRPIVAGRARVASGTGMDFSCYVEIDNTHRSTDLELVGARATDGFFPVEPPESIPAGARARFWVQDSFGPAGSSATVTYTDGDRTHELRVACPTFGTNSVAGAHEIATRAGEGPWKRGEVVRWGHPFFVDVTI